MEKCDNVTIPMATTKIDADLQGTPTDQTKYRSMIGGLMYLTASRPNIAFITFDSRFELIAYSDADLAGCLDDYKSTSRGIQFLGDKIVDWSSKKQDCTSMSTAEAETEYQLVEKALPSERFEYLDHRIAQLVPKFQSIGRCNNYIVLLSMPCSPESKIVGQILLDHPLSYALTVTADVSGVCLQQFWKTVSKVSNTKDTIKFKLDTQDITYTVGMFRDTLHLLVETLDNLFVAPVNIEIIKSFMQIVGYQGVVDKVSAFYTKFLAQPWQTKFKKKDVIQYPCFTKLIIADLMKKFPSILLRLEEDYHSIKDDILLVSVYTTGNVIVQRMLISDAFLTDEICDTYDYKEATPIAHRTPTLTTASPQGKKRKQSAGETSSPITQGNHQEKVQSITLITPPCDDRARGEIAEATLLSLILYKIALAAEAQENIAKVKEKLDEEEIEKMVEEPKSHKENLEVVDDDNKDDKKDEDDKKDDDVEKTDDAAEDKDNDDHTDHALVETHATGSMENRNEQMQIPIPSPNRSPRKH
nr:hypothetical protein [Tanacetum cinerariifolium]